MQPTAYDDCMVFSLHFTPLKPLAQDTNLQKAV